MTDVDPKLKPTFDKLVACAVAGERCPTSAFPGNVGNINSGKISALARAGHILVEISTHNWRRVTILTGEHKGKATLPNPMKHHRVWQVLDTRGKVVNGAIEIRPTNTKPSMPKMPWNDK